MIYGGQALHRPTRGDHKFIVASMVSRRPGRTFSDLVCGTGVHRIHYGTRIHRGKPETLRGICTLCSHLGANRRLLLTAKRSPLVVPGFIRLRRSNPWGGCVNKSLVRSGVRLYLGALAVPGHSTTSSTAARAA